MIASAVHCRDDWHILELCQAMPASDPQEPEPAFHVLTELDRAALIRWPNGG